MSWRLLAVAVIWSSLGALPLGAQELTTPAERSYRALRDSKDVKTKLMAERWYGAIRQQDWTDATGKFRTTAKYLEHDPNLAWVKLRVVRGTGKDRTVKDLQIPLEKLSDTCKARVRTISLLSEKIATAVQMEKEEENDKEDSTEGSPGGEVSEAAMPAGEARRMEEAPTDRSPPRRARRTASSRGPALPALIPPLPSDRARLGQPPAETAAPQDVPAAEDES